MTFNDFWNKLNKFIEELLNIDQDEDEDENEDEINNEQTVE